MKTPREIRKESVEKCTDEHCESCFDAGYSEAVKMLRGRQAAFESCDDHERRMIGNTYCVITNWLESKMKEEKVYMKTKPLENSGFSYKVDIHYPDKEEEKK